MHTMLIQAFKLYPEAADSAPRTLEDDQKPALSKQLQTFGFTEKQVHVTIRALSTPSALTSTLLSSFEPLQACLEHLVLHLPECDLPQRFLPSSNSSNPFISSVHSGTEDLKTRWAVDQAVKECGWPAHIVKELVKDRLLVENWGLLQQALNRILVGRAGDDISADQESDGLELLDEDELNAYDAKLVDKTHLVVPLPIAPFELHVILPKEEQSLPLHGEPPPMYITSKTIAAYVRLHILSQLLSAFQNDTLLDPGESVIMAAVRFIEEQWANIEDNGPPEMSQVLRYFMRGKADVEDAETTETLAMVQQKRKGRQQKGTTKRDDRNDATVKAKFEELRQKKAYIDILSSRKRLPAFAAHDTFLDMLERNRCVVVVGETGMLFHHMTRQDLLIIILDRMWKDNTV